MTKGRSSSLYPVLFAVCSILLSSCQSTNSARGVVDRFIEAHYMAISLKSAEPLCTGLALSKLKDEERLTAGQDIDASTRKPIIHYKLQEERTAQDRVMYLFLATIEVPDGGSFKKKWMITARREGPTWKISNYSEYD